MKKMYLKTLMILVVMFGLAFSSCDNGANGAKGNTGPTPIHEWLLDGSGTDSAGGKDLTLNTAGYVSFETDPDMGRSVLFVNGKDGTANANSGVVADNWNAAWVPDFNGPSSWTGFTASAWIKPKDIDGLRQILMFELPNDTNAGVYILCFDSDFLYLGYAGGGGDGSYGACMDYMYSGPDYLQYDDSGNLIPTWMHIALTYKGSTVALYVNGEKVGERTGTLPGAIWWDASGVPSGVGAQVDIPIKAPTIDSFWIGGRRPTQFYVGYISDVRLYDRALSDSEIKTQASNFNN